MVPYHAFDLRHSSRDIYRANSATLLPRLPTSEEFFLILIRVEEFYAVDLGPYSWMVNTYPRAFHLSFRHLHFLANFASITNDHDREVVQDVAQVERIPTVLRTLLA